MQPEYTSSIPRSIHGFERLRMAEFEPIQGRIVIKEPKGKERVGEEHICQTCVHYHPGHDVTMQDDACGGCCSWNDHWEARE